MKIRNGSTYRVRRNQLAGLSGFAVILAPTLALFVILRVASVSLDRSVALACAFVAVGTFAMNQFQSRRPRSRRVMFLAKSRSSFAQNIFRGLADGLASLSDLQVSASFPPSNQDGRTYQLTLLRSLEITRADALIIIPAADDHLMWQNLGRIMRRGTLVVCIDTKPPNHYFREHGLEPPFFVGSDFMGGGRMVGRFLATHLNTQPDAHAIVAVGPETSWPAKERASWILYELAAAGCVSRCRAVELDNWDAKSGATTLLGSVEAILDEGCQQLIVFAGNDKLAFELNVFLDRHRGACRDADVRVLGYDGTTTDAGDRLLEGIDRALATVDTRPFDQGTAAAEFVAWAYEGSRIDFTKRIVDPNLVGLDRAGSDGSPVLSRQATR